MTFTRWLVKVLILGWGLGAWFAIFADLVSGQPAGPGVGIRPRQAVQVPGEGPGTAVGATFRGSVGGKHRGAAENGSPGRGGGGGHGR